METDVIAYEQLESATKEPISGGSLIATVHDGKGVDVCSDKQ